MFVGYLVSGMYWIDPNGGTVKDAIWVYCEKTKKSSCVYPKYSRVINGSFCLVLEHTVELRLAITSFIRSPR